MYFDQSVTGLMHAIKYSCICAAKVSVGSPVTIAKVTIVIMS